MMQSYDIPLHDIKPIVEVHEFSMYYLIGLISVVVLVVAGVLYLLFLWMKKRNRFSIRKEHYKFLQELSFDDTKKSAYAVTLYGATFKDDSPRHTEMFNNLTNRLDGYKYKKHVQEFDQETLGYIELYKEMCHA